jgi:ABC-type hemin transport system substrate-binding protein
VFAPNDIQAMSTALDDVCKVLNLPDKAASERELIAKKIIAFAHQGKRDAALLRDRMLREIVAGRGDWP